MNTGIQRSGATPKYASTTTSPAGKAIHGKQEWKKEMPFIVAGHGNHVYVATANIAYPLDFFNKLKIAIEHKGPSYIQVFTPCVPGWKIPSDMTMEIAKLAFKSNITPLFEIKEGILTINKKPSEKIPVKDYLQTQGRFKHMTEEEIKEVQKNTDEKIKAIENLEKTKVKIL